MNEALARSILDDGAESISYGARRPTPSPHGGRRRGSDLNARSETAMALAEMLTWLRRPTSVTGGKADMARTCRMSANDP